MKCINPVLCYRLSNGKKIFRHFQIAKHTTLLHTSYPTLVLNCGHCLICRKRRSYELAMRSVLHASCFKDNMFLTLTYDEKKEGYHNVKQYPDIQKFKKSLRRNLDYHFQKKIDIFNVHEYGKNGKKHWHLLVFNHQFSDLQIYKRTQAGPLHTSATLEKLWPAGFSTIADLSEGTAMYQAQYMEKDFKNGNITNSKKSQSKHQGLGKPFFMKHYNQILRLGYVPFNGKKHPIPRYFEKLAHKHWSHYNEPSNFFDTLGRKKLYSPFKVGQENKQISDLYSDYLITKADKIKELEFEFKDTIELFLGSKLVPEFEQSGSNIEYDYKKRTTHERF